MKKPMFHVKSWIFLIITVLISGSAMLPFFIKNNGFIQADSPTPLVLMGLAIVMFAVTVITDIRASKQESKWYWENRKEEIVKTRLNYVNGNKPTVEDVQTIKPNTKYRFNVFYKGRNCDTEVDSSDPDLHLLLDKMTNYKLNNDRHITKTQILAVNNNQIIDTQQRASIGKALLGGLIAGEAGFILGGLSGSSTSVVRNGPNRYTFLVVYDDRAPVTETETEGSKRFQFLLTKLEV